MPHVIGGLCKCTSYTVEPLTLPDPLMCRRTLMLNPALALVSMNITLNSRALASPSSMDT